MKMNLSSTTKKLNIDFMKELHLDLHITQNPFELPLGSLFQIAARKNKKRHFLFASCVIGKYISVNPKTPLVTSLLLSHLFLKKVEGKSPYDEQVLARSLSQEEGLDQAYAQRLQQKAPLSKQTLFIAFAETATGLGHGVFNGVGENAHFIHTTRDSSIPLQSSFDFEEEHSHATSHFCYDEEGYMEEAERIVLIDDEITTGKTAINLISALHARTPKQEYVVLTILDWRRPHEMERFKELEKSLGVKIHVLSLVSGHVHYEHEVFEYQEESRSYPSLVPRDVSEFVISPPVSSVRHMKGESHHALSGKFGLSYLQNVELEQEASKIAEVLRVKRRGKNTLCLGYGEFLFLPNLVASKMGEHVQYHSVARSPIYHMSRSDYPLSDVIRFFDPKLQVDMHLYNVIPNAFDEVFLFSEQTLPHSITEQLKEELAKRGIVSIHFVSLFKGEK